MKMECENHLQLPVPYISSLLLNNDALEFCCTVCKNISMDMQGQKTPKTSCTLYKLTSVSVNVTLEISCTVCKTSLWKCRVKRH